MGAIETSKLFRFPTSARMLLRPAQRLAYRLPEYSRVVITDIYIEKADAGDAVLTLGYATDPSDTPITMFTIEVTQRLTQINLQSGWHLTAGLEGVHQVVVGNASGTAAIMPIISGYLEPSASS
jgi:hypothetical protein